MLHTRFKAESPVLKVGSRHGTQPTVTGLSAFSRKPNLDKPAALPCPYNRCIFRYFNSVCAPDLNNPPIFCEISGLGMAPASTMHVRRATGTGRPDACKMPFSVGYLGDFLSFSLMSILDG